MADHNEFHYREYLERMRDVQEVVPQQDQPVTARFQTLQPTEQVRIVPVERHECQAHSGVCVEVANAKAEIVALKNAVDALKADRGSMRSFWFALIAAAVGSGIGAAVSVLVK